MQGRWWTGAIVGVVLISGVWTGWALRHEPSDDSERARYLSLRLLPLEEWGFSKEAHAPVPVPLPSALATSPVPTKPPVGKRRFRVTIPGDKKEIGPISERNEVAVYLRIDRTPKSPAQQSAQTQVTLNSQFLQNQMRRQTQMLQMVQSRLDELQRLLKRTASSLRPPQKRVIQMDMEMLQLQLAALQQAQMMTLQALAFASQGPRYIRISLAPTLIVSEKFLERMATDGEAVRLGPVEFARATRVKVEAIN